MWSRSTKQRKAARRRREAYREAALAAGLEWLDEFGARLERSDAHLVAALEAGLFGPTLEVTTYAPLPERPTMADVFRSVYSGVARTYSFPRWN